MHCYRIAPRKHNNAHNALTGQGGLYAEGRWHNVGAPIVYCASTRSLAILERLANDSTDMVSQGLSIATIEIPEQVGIKTIARAEMPDNWNSLPYTKRTQELGSAWLNSYETAVLKVPSSICPHEFNFIINPMHEDVARWIKCVGVEGFKYPGRLLKYAL